MLPCAVKLSESTWPGSGASKSAAADAQGQDRRTERGQEGLNCRRVIPSCQHTVELGNGMSLLMAFEV